MKARQAAIRGKVLAGLPPTGSGQSNNTAKRAEVDEPMDFSRPAFSSELPDGFLARAEQRARDHGARFAAIAAEMPFHTHSGHVAGGAQSSTPKWAELDDPIDYSHPALARKKPAIQRRREPRQAARPLRPQDVLSAAACASTAGLQPGGNASREAPGPSAPG